jgi:ribonucleoside-diphosphate reductase beta chain
MERVKRYTLFPICDEESYKFFKIQQAALWDSNEMDFSRDVEQYDNLPENMKRIIDYVYAFFSSADGAVNENIMMRFFNECDTFEQKCFYISQMYIEAVHAETYSLTINTLIKDPEKRDQLFAAIEVIPVVNMKMQWIEKWLNSDLSRAHRLLAFVCVEGILFQSSFFYIFWFRSKGILNNIVFSNEQISKDENLHCSFAISLLNRLDKLPIEDAHAIVSQAVDIEDKFIETVTPEKIDDLEPQHAKDYVRTLANIILERCGYPQLYKVDALPNWIYEIASQQKNNFYEVRVGSYKQFSLQSVLNWKDRLTKKENVYQNIENIEF